MKTTLHIQNLKCAGCEHSVIKKLSSLDGIKEVIVDLEDSTVMFSHQDEAQIDRVQIALAKLGYPVAGKRNSLGAKTKSYVSCAVGKLTKA